MNARNISVAWVLAVTTTLVLLSFGFRRSAPSKKKIPFEPPRGCVFRTIMGEESAAGQAAFKTPERVQKAVDRGLDWIAAAQQHNGGWGAGSHRSISDPHAVPADPATTAMVAMSLLRSGTTPGAGPYSANLRRAMLFLLDAAESSADNSLNITNLTGTQIQTKLGQYIDVILTSQFLSNIQPLLSDDPAMLERVKRCQQVCVDKMQRAQADDGSVAGSGWAGVLQSSFATTALEAAEASGADVDKSKLEMSRAFQQRNYNAKTGEVNTALGAGIMLYSVSGSVRASAKQARKAAEDVQRAMRDGRLSAKAAPTAESLRKIGYTQEEAESYAGAYSVYQSAKVEAQRDDVMSGFGSNGGEEFLSYLQTGESMIVNRDESWQQWYDNMAGRLLGIQQQDGSWEGHHCITSPVFCTATCLLILAVNNDVNTLEKIGAR